jgi:outer membrane biosynthesis protein TonB
MLAMASLAVAQQPTDNPPPPSQTDAPTAPAAADPELVNQVQQLQAEVDQLKAQVAQLNALVEQLQSERAAAPAPAPTPAEKNTTKKGAAKKASPSLAKTPAATANNAAAPVAEETSPTTILVFRDGHRTEARNYAIVGQTLWIYTQDESQKVPLAELDVTATKNANSDRGIIFQMPPTR